MERKCVETTFCDRGCLGSYRREYLITFVVTSLRHVALEYGVVGNDG